MNTLNHLVRRSGGVTGDCTIETCPVEASIYGYYPSLGFNSAFVAIFALSAVVYYHQLLLFKSYRFFSACMALGCLLEAGGYIGRILLHDDPFSRLGFDLNVILLTVAPAFLSAGIYVTIKTLTQTFSPGLSRLRPSWYPWVFVVCDGVSITLQAVGGAMSASAEDMDVLDAGVNVMIAGLVSQVVTLSAFVYLCVEFLMRCKKNPGKLNPGTAKLAKTGRFQLFAGALAVSFFCIYVRCVYRIAELSGGWGNEIMRNEAEFIVLESDMIVISAIALNAFHPSIFFKEPKTEPDFIVDEHGDFKKNNMAADMAEKDYCRRCRRGTQSPPPRVRPRVGLNRQPSNPPYYKV
ncbi:hypothetical protein MBLNU230_g8540t1 [Neophaeotheca triangularis]